MSESSLGRRWLLTSASNWSPVPSKHKTNVRLPPASGGGMILGRGGLVGLTEGASAVVGVVRGVGEGMVG